jgi:hypothetical protein
LFSDEKKIYQTNKKKKKMGNRLIQWVRSTTIDDDREEEETTTIQSQLDAFDERLRNIENPQKEDELRKRIRQLEMENSRLRICQNEYIENVKRGEMNISIDHLKLYINDRVKEDKDIKPVETLFFSILEAAKTQRFQWANHEFEMNVRPINMEIPSMESSSSEEWCRF